MSAIIILIIASLFVATGFLIAYFWSVKNGQYDDDYTPSVRILFDNEVLKSPEGDLPSAQFPLGKKRVSDGSSKNNIKP